MLLEQLSMINGVSGNEAEIRKFIINEIKDYVDDIKIDKIGNLIVYKNGFKTNSKIVVSSHMDEVGLIVNGIDSQGLIKFTLIGDVDERILVSKPVLIGNNKIKGVIGSKPIHLQEKNERKKVLKYSQLYIDIGSSNKEETEKLVNIGDYVSFCSDFIEFGDNLYKGKALDNRAGCNILIELLKKNELPSFYAVFSVMKEIGINAGLTANYSLNPDINIILDSSSKEKSLGKGPIISFMENRTHFNKELTKKTIDLAHKNNIKHQLAGSDTNNSDANVIQTSRSGSSTIKIAIPHKYSYSPVNIISKIDLEYTNKLILDVLNYLGGNYIENK